jgi:hypothetical protein
MLSAVEAFLDFFSELARIIRGKSAVEVQPFRSEGNAAAPRRCKRVRLPMRSLEKRSNIVLCRTTNWHFGAGAFAPSESHLDRHIAMTFTPGMNNSG